jgi:hypothetical protein
MACISVSPLIVSATARNNPAGSFLALSRISSKRRNRHPTISPSGYYCSRRFDYLDDNPWNLFLCETIASTLDQRSGVSHKKYLPYHSGHPSPGRGRRHSGSLRLPRCGQKRVGKLYSITELNFEVKDVKSQQLSSRSYPESGPNPPCNVGLPYVSSVVREPRERHES